jgi:ribosomal protein S18 acetylase RimI-like enzyme
MKVRVATGADAEDIARVHVASWQVAYRGLMPDSILDALDARHRIARWREILARPQAAVFVAEEDSHIVGFCDLLPSRDLESDPKSVGEIAAIYIYPGYYRKGIGRDLLASALREARNRGFTSVTLWVLKTNSAAIQFYKSIGFAPDGATKTEMLRDFALDEIRFRLRL